MKASSDSYDIEVTALKKKLADRDEELSMRPPITFESLLEKIGVFGNFASINDVTGTSKKISWAELEG